MSLSGTFSYDRYSDVACPLSLTADYGFTGLELEIDFGGGDRGFLITETADVSVSTPDAGIFRVVGTGNTINSAIATLRYIADVNGAVPTVVGNVTVRVEGTGTLLAMGTATFTPNIATYPSYSWETPPLGSQTTVSYSGTSPVTVAFPKVSTTSEYSQIEITHIGNFTGANGSIIAPVTGEFVGNSIANGGVTLSGSTAAINAYLSDIAYVPASGGYDKYNIRVYGGFANSVGVTSTVEFNFTGSLAVPSSYERVSGVFYTLSGISIGPPGNAAAATYTVNIKCDGADAYSVTPVGGVSASSDLTKGITITGGHRSDTNATVATCGTRMFADGNVVVTASNSLGFISTKVIPYADISASFSYVGTIDATPVGNTFVISFPAGTQAGDRVIITDFNNNNNLAPSLPFSGGAGGTWYGTAPELFVSSNYGGGRLLFAHKAVQAGDLSATLTYPNANGYVRPCGVV